MSVTSAGKPGSRRRFFRRSKSPNKRIVDRELSLDDLRSRFQARGEEPRLFLEIGANDGTDTNRLLEAFPKIQIHCFEPDPRAIAAFKRNVRSSRAQLHEVAVGAQDGPMTLYQSSGAPPGREQDFPEGWHLSNSLRAPKDHLTVHPWCRFESTTQVPVLRLDTWASRTGVTAVDFIWADVQGAEMDVITGGQRTLRATTFIYTEWADQELYEGQVRLETIEAALTNHSLIQRFRHDALFELIRSKWEA